MFAAGGQEIVNFADVFGKEQFLIVEIFDLCPAKFAEIEVPEFIQSGVEIARRKQRQDFIKIGKQELIKFRQRDTERIFSLSSETVKGVAPYFRKVLKLRKTQKTLRMSERSDTGDNFNALVCGIIIGPPPKIIIF